MGQSLVTTALEQSWPTTGPVVFLGQWCQLFSRRDKWSQLGHRIVAYHWDDTEKRRTDIIYLTEVYERLLTELASRLNSIHSVSHSTRYWRIAIGPWLSKFTDMLFDRWENVDQALSQYNLETTITLSGIPNIGPTTDTREFMALSNTDEWNHHIYSMILESRTTLQCIEHAWQPLDITSTLLSRSPYRSWRDIIGSPLLTAYSSCSNRFIRDTDSVLFRTYMPRRFELTVQARLHQVPILYENNNPITVRIIPELRAWKWNENGTSLFESFLRQMIPQYIPTVFLEGYYPITQELLESRWPNRPNLIWTSNAHQYCDVFKLWTAEKVEQGSLLVIGQHGGRYGIARHLRTEEHELKVCDRYLSWGWDDPDSNKVIPVGQLKFVTPTRRPSSNAGGLTLVTAAVRQHASSATEDLYGPQWPEYFELQCDFVRALTTEIRDFLTVRLYPGDFGWDQELQWRAQFEWLNLDLAELPLHKVVSRDRLVVSSYNSTTFLESLSADIPTVVFWETGYREIRQSAQYYFNLLEQVGVFHSSPIAAAQHVSAVWGDVQGWWTSAQVTEAVAKFKKRYCHIPDSLSGRVTQALQETIDGHLI